LNAYALLHRSGFRGFLRRLYRIEVTGSEYVPATGGAILVANHESIWDPFILGLATPREIHYLAKAELFRWPLGGVLRSLNAFPVERGSGDRAAIGEAARRLGRGELIGIFPQGTSKPERQNGWHRGAARLALVAGVPVVPVRLAGTRPLPLPTQIRIDVGQPIQVSVARPTIAAARALTARFEEEVTCGRTSARRSGDRDRPSA
jgi:1-acyl-sn-glycerol-3-phosphate acyltransferase